MEKEFLIISEQGLHARPVTKLVDLATSFDADIFISVQGRRVNMKSIMGVMSLGINQGQRVVLSIDGDEAQRANDALTKFLTSDGLAKLV